MNRNDSKSKGSSKRNNSYNSKKGYSKSASRERSSGKDFKESIDGSFEKRAGQNDASWYALNDALLKDAASLAYSWPVGAPVQLGEIEDRDRADTVPGILTISTTLTPGISVDGSSPVNTAARLLYSYVRHKNSGHSNYNSPDLMLYILAMDNIYSAIAHGVRAYGVARTFSQTNRYYPEAVLHAMGFEPEEMRNNLANFRFALNTAIIKASSMAVPGDMPLLLRHQQIFSYIYTDTPNTAKCQTFQYVPDGFYKFSFNTVDTGGSLDWIPCGYHGYNVEENKFKGKNMTTVSYIEMLNEMLSAIVSDEDMNIMSGDILKAWDANGRALFRMSTVPEDYTVVPVFNPEILTQINNTVIMGAPTLNNEFSGPHHPTYGVSSIWQEGDNILYNPQFQSSVHEFELGTKIPELEKLILNMPMEHPMPADTMVATRFMNIATKEKDGSVTYEHIGSEIATFAFITSFTWASGTRERLIMPIYSHIVISSTGTDLASQISFRNLSMAGNLSKFDNHPRVYPYLVVEEDNNLNILRLASYGDIGTFSLLNAHDLAKMHTTALLTEYNVPSMGTWAV